LENGLVLRPPKRGREPGEKDGLKGMIRILLCGANGKMGRVVENVISGRDDMEIVAGVDLNTKAYAAFPIYASIEEFSGEADAVVDFSHPDTLASLLSYVTRTKTPLVAATTGYSPEQTAAIRAASEETAIFFTFNLSLGVNLLIDLAKRAMSVLGDQFDVEIVEKHHNQKIDAPSGTALMLADALNETAGERYQYQYDRHSRRGKRQPNEIGIHSVRGGTITGEHEVIFAGRDEVLSLRHTASSREVFAVGAVNAAAFLAGKPAGLYQMGDLLGASR